MRAAAWAAGGQGGLHPQARGWAQPMTHGLGCPYAAQAAALMGSLPKRTLGRGWRSQMIMIMKRKEKGIPPLERGKAIAASSLSSGGIPYFIIIIILDFQFLLVFFKVGRKVGPSPQGTPHSFPGLGVEH